MTDNNSKNTDTPVIAPKFSLSVLLIAAAIIIPYNILEHVSYNKAAKQVYENTVSGNHSNVTIDFPFEYKLYYESSEKNTSIYTGDITEQVCSTLARNIIQGARDDSQRVFKISGYEIETPKDIYTACKFAVEEDKIIIE